MLRHQFDEPRRPAPPCRLIAVGFIASAWLLAAPLVSAQPLPRLFDGAWMGFDTGRFPDPNPSGFAPNSVAVGDLDGDGLLDIVVGQAYFAGPGVSVLKALGGGTFDRPAYFALPMNDAVGRVALVDVDADLDLDVVATIPDAFDLGTDIALWRNDGTGALAAPERFVVGADPIGIATGDLTGDGHPDIVTANAGAGTISLLEHDGGAGAAAGYLPARPISVGGIPRYVLVADVTGDGALDLVVSRMGDFTPLVTVLVGNGLGSFVVGREFGTDAGGPAGIALGDVDRDGDLDLAIAGQQDAGRDAVRILGNDGRGAFGTWAENVTTGTPRCTDLALADLNGDAFLDVVAIGPNGRSQESWSALLGDGSGRHLPGSPYPSSQNSEAIAAFDADGDGDAEVATLARYSSAVNLWTNPGSGIFPVPPRHRVDGAPHDIDAADLDGDGDLDAVSAAATMQVHRNVGDGTFSAAEPIPTPQGMATIQWIKLRDLSGDGIPDLLMSPGGNGNFGVARNRGDGTFMPADVWPSPGCGGGPIDAFDFDADGDRDVVLAGCGDGFGESILIAANDGVARFVNEPPLTCQLGGNSVEAADVDGDTVLDLVVNENGLGLATFHGNGDLSFAADVLSVDPPPLLARIGDFDGDGVVDAAVVIGQGSAGTDSVGIARGRGDGTFDNPVLQSGSSTIEPLLLTADLNVGHAGCDGTLDVVATYYASNDLGFFEGVGDTMLRPQVRHGATLVPRTSVLGDFTGDGVLDIATIGQPITPCCSPALVVLAGRCPCPGVNPNPAPPGEARDLRVTRQADALTFAWQPSAPTAASYRIVSGTIGAWYDHRADDSQGMGICSTPVSPWTDPDDGALDSVNRYYLVIGVSDCEGLVGSAGSGWDGRRFIPRPGAIPTASCP